MKAIFHSACRSDRSVCIFSAGAVRKVALLLGVCSVRSGPNILRSELRGGCYRFCACGADFRHINKDILSSVKSKLWLFPTFFPLHFLPIHQRGRTGETGEGYRAVPARLSLKNPTAELISNSWGSTPLWFRRQQKKSGLAWDTCVLLSRATHRSTFWCTNSSTENEGIILEKKQECRHQREPFTLDWEALATRSTQWIQFQNFWNATRVRGLRDNCVRHLCEGSHFPRCLLINLKSKPPFLLTAAAAWGTGEVHL